MKLLKALLAIFTLLAVALTGVLLFVQDKSSKPHTQTQKPRNARSGAFLCCGFTF